MPKMTITNRATEGKWTLQDRLVWSWVYLGGGEITGHMNGGSGSAPPASRTRRRRWTRESRGRRRKQPSPRLPPQFINRIHEEDSLLYA